MTKVQLADWLTRSKDNIVSVAYGAKYITIKTKYGTDVAVTKLSVMCTSIVKEILGVNK